MQVQCLGRWWASVPRPAWPEGQESAITEDFAEPDGDRRQELVFIGIDAANPKVRLTFINDITRRSVLSTEHRGRHRLEHATVLT